MLTYKLMGKSITVPVRMLIQISYRDPSIELSACNSKSVGSGGRGVMGWWTGGLVDLGGGYI